MVLFWSLALNTRLFNNKLQGVKESYCITFIGGTARVAGIRSYRTTRSGTVRALPINGADCWQARLLLQWILRERLKPMDGAIHGMGGLRDLLLRLSQLALGVNGDTPRAFVSPSHSRSLLQRKRQHYLGLVGNKISRERSGIILCVKTREIGVVPAEWMVPVKQYDPPPFTDMFSDTLSVPSVFNLSSLPLFQVPCFALWEMPLWEFNNRTRPC
ncbi:hypothetical protein NEUTE1DRAFT_108895 [Neurospora tetrasperma FGSC 2508]|uniref:Uncharacterized protein n=1 Tax=Neurospora tetrasperma (strain FGSC 2508 / ATCC MYA-4615 / P0657) TaxID=510951 RepID=F8MG38_NEUT8|nr:uncharacterized protein NEUTE1DRAFT_108895 [Neurospora tetrasperma FGSC 2508]EGO59364.1 hypothetical protein NEUTE1DRAFT_108895 [Neurospora tetrasperma FGSC 2508]EGZ73484.1 hypothetical protein NEUTE2DRAFT_127845 [Neurospora tetrasperma FGSC 2509]